MIKLLFAHITWQNGNISDGVVLCKSGARATAAGTALRHIGFENVYVLKGGFKALTGYLGPVEANTPLSPAPVKK